MYFMTAHQTSKFPWETQLLDLYVHKTSQHKLPDNVDNQIQAIWSIYVNMCNSLYYSYPWKSKTWNTRMLIEGKNPTSVCLVKTIWWITELLNTHQNSLQLHHHHLSQQICSPHDPHRHSRRNLWAYWPYRSWRDAVIRSEHIWPLWAIPWCAMENMPTTTLSKMLGCWRFGMLNADLNVKKDVNTLWKREVHHEWRWDDEHRGFHLSYSF